MKECLTQNLLKRYRRTRYHGICGVADDDSLSSTLQKGQNTANMCIARLLMRYIGERNVDKQDYYDPEEFLERLVVYMTTKPHPETDPYQVQAHNDTYLDVFMRNFFKEASKGTALRNCAMTQRDQWSIGSLDGVAMCIPIIVAYADEPEAMVTGRAVEHHMLTHRSITVTMVVTVLVPLLLELFKGAELREALDRAMEKLRPPKCTGRQQRDSYVNNHGPHNIPKHEKWLQHMLTTDESTKDFIHRMVEEATNKLCAGAPENQDYQVPAIVNKAFMLFCTWRTNMVRKIRRRHYYKMQCWVDIRRQEVQFLEQYWELPMGRVAFRSLQI